MDDAFCGGGDTNEGYSNTAVTIQPAAVAKIAAAIFAGDPRHIAGLSYNVGSCQASGVRYHFFPNINSPFLCHQADGRVVRPSPSRFPVPISLQDPIVLRRH